MHAAPPLLRPAALAAAMVLCACGGPGVATPMPEPPAIDLGGYRGQEGAAPVSDAALESVTFALPPGATRGGAQVRMTNLSTLDEPSNTFANDDGSFALTTLAAPGHTLRLQAIADGLHGPPADIEYLAGGGFVPVARPACLVFEPALALALEADGPDGEMTVSNGCENAVTLQNPRARLQLPDFTLTTPLPLSIEPGEEATLTVVFAANPAGAGGEREDVLFVDAIGAGPAPLLYPITVFGDAEP